MATFYCKWCGDKNSTIRDLTSYNCTKNPYGQKHEPYEGDEKKEYVCKYCGAKNSTIRNLTSYNCSNSPSGKHVPL